MSSSNQATINNFVGGAPAKKDYIPAIIFSVALGLTLPLLAWRLLSKKHTHRVLANQIAFFLTRLASLIIRAYTAKRQYGDGTLIAELVLMSVGYLFLINSLIDLWEAHVQNNNNDHPVVDKEQSSTYFHNPNDHPATKVKWAKYLATFLRLVLLAALATAIAAGAILRKSITNSQKQKLVADLIKSSYVLALGTTAVGLLANWIVYFTHRRSLKRTLFLTAYTIPILISGIYRVVETFTGRYKATSAEIAGFWVAAILFEVIAYSLLLAISIPKWFKHHAHNTADQEKTGRHSSSTAN